MPAGSCVLHMPSGTQEQTLAQSQRDLLMRFVAGRVEDAALREDLVQEALLRLVAYGQSNPIRNWAALARKVAVNLINEHFRSRRRHPTQMLDEALPCTNPLQEQVLMHRQRLEIFQRVLQEMPPLRREVLIRRRLRGESCEAIGRALSLSPQAVEKHMTRALRQLHGALNQSDEDSTHSFDPRENTGP